MQGLTGSREGPIVDHIEFRLRRAVAVTGQIVANIFDTFLEEIAFTQLQRQTVFLANEENAFEVEGPAN